MQILSKLTFSLVFVLMLALIAGPALAQTVNISEDINTDGATTPGPLGKSGFVVFEMPTAGQGTTGANGIDASVSVVTAADAANFPSV